MAFTGTGVGKKLADLVLRHMKRPDFRAGIISEASTNETAEVSGIAGKKQVIFSNRDLVDQVRADSNRGAIIYGDWGSTRPREYQSGGGPIPPRIDYPLDNSWWFFRDPDHDWDFRRAAAELVDSEVWDGTTGQWGEQMIAETSVNQSLGINSAQKNVTARVNIHLHRQTFFGGPLPPPAEFEDDWDEF